MSVETAIVMGVLVFLGSLMVLFAAATALGSVVLRSREKRKQERNLKEWMHKYGAFRWRD